MASLKGNNVKRARWAGHAIKNFAIIVGQEINDDRENLNDLLSDLMHWAESKNIDIEKEWESAQEAYIYERENPHE